MTEQDRQLQHDAAGLPDAAAVEKVVAQVLDEARRAGASAAEAGVNMDLGLSVTVRLGEVETLEYHRDRGLGVTVYFGRRKGSASSSDLSPQAIRETVAAACDIARYTSEDSCAGLAPAERMARETPDLDLYHPWDIDADRAIELARICEDAARGQDPRISNSEGATLASHAGLRVYGNSHGFIGGYPSSRHSISCSVIAEQDGQMQRDYWYTVARAREDLEPPEAVGRTAAERTLRRLGARKLSTRQAPVLFSAELAGGLFRSFVSAIRGGNLYRRSSFLLDCLGQPVFPDFVHIHEQPHLPRALGSAPFDSEGVATAPRDLVRDGILQGYVLDSYSACKLGMETTGNAGGVHNLSIDPTAGDQAALLRQMSSGLLVTELMGQGVNIVTGDYSRGAAGFWVEDGELQYPVEEITVAGNLRDMFRDLVAIGSDIDTRGSIRTGSVLLAPLTLAGD
ncbi:metalloprotease PmbA [Thiohalobacter sp. IOR34]|uniref:metalloprotease PmbA n=1 Tax=Thiohalobacter sp. IOR34 TaxID=3057176 RepID=UPI0025B04FBB|nr:metalloprotease PmbA [Thiohalobacter sp. IOR34]WJW76847.1 metalloprotease PmbA [Thiohalobacter sp. IOR34]